MYKFLLFYLHGTFFLFLNCLSRLIEQRTEIYFITYKNLVSLSPSQGLGFDMNMLRMPKVVILLYRDNSLSEVKRGTHRMLNVRSWELPSSLIQANKNYYFGGFAFSIIQVLPKDGKFKF